ncbi:GD17480 [Drosophila simulans]|uniref:GD17480 n=1 Tax=Drosophila simulans TaxID=7240 RepID=B4R2W3_DROSI|nr:GD17480 [Drosophila simulans]
MQQLLVVALVAVAIASLPQLAAGKKLGKRCVNCTYRTYYTYGDGRSLQRVVYRDPVYTRAQSYGSGCSGSPCGVNAVCQEASGGRPVCSCPPGFSGNPLTHCNRGECLDNVDCRGNLQCKDNRCVNPCVGACGIGSNCDARNHVAVCSCPAGYNGDPYHACHLNDPAAVSAANFECPKPNGQFADEVQCDKFYVCDDGVAKAKLCPDGLVFDPLNRKFNKCDQPFNVDCEDRTELQEPKSSKYCPRKNGFFAHPDPAVCNIFYNCIEGDALETKCTVGLHFDEYSGTCVWPDTAKREGCNPEQRTSETGFVCPKDQPKTDDRGQVVTHPQVPASHRLPEALRVTERRGSQGSGLPAGRGLQRCHRDVRCSRECARLRGLVQGCGRQEGLSHFRSLLLLLIASTLTLMHTHKHTERNYQSNQIETHRFAS